MTLQYASDLHLEFSQNKHFLKTNPLQAKGDILLLAGDVVPFIVMNKHRDFFSYVADHFRTTYWVPGNHEYYYFDAATRCGVLNERIRSNIFLVNNVAVQHEAVHFIFSTLWSKISPAYERQIEKSMSDFQLIKYQGFRFSATRFNELHAESRTFMNQALTTQKAGKSVVVTHHVPTFLNYPAKFKGDVLSEAFAVELFDLIEANGPDYWIYGHHHYNLPDFAINNTHLLTNQLGYVEHNEHLQFVNHKTFTV